MKLHMNILALGLLAGLGGDRKLSPWSWRQASPTRC